MKYIPADKLIAEIESRMEDCKLPDGRFPTTTSIVRYEELSCLRNFISSLQQEQPEVDLETEVEEWWQNWASPPRNEYAVFNKEEFINLARHFFEIGLNARKEE